MHDWRKDPATDRQKRRLKDECIPFHRSITKGEASDLIGEMEPATGHDVAVLKYFRVPGAAKMSETAARRKVEELFSDPGHKGRWENRPADVEQKAIYKFFQMPVPAGLKHKDATVVINELFEDDEKMEAWDTHQDDLWQREDALEDAYGAVAADIGVPRSVAEWFAGRYASVFHTPSDRAGPYGMDRSATNNVPAGYAAKCLIP